MRKTAIAAAKFLTTLAMMATSLVAPILLAPALFAPVLLAQSTGSPAEKDFVSGGKVEITLESGDYDLRASADNRIHVRWNEASAKSVRVKLTVNGKQAEVRVENTPKNNFHASIEVPAISDLRIRLTAGNLGVSGIKGDKDIEANAGNLNISVGNSSDWGDVDAAVTAGALDAPPFEGAKGGLFRSLKWKGPGKYKLYARLTAGNLSLEK